MRIIKKEEGILQIMRVSQELVDKVIEFYKPNYRYLREATVNYPFARGRFLLNETEYMTTLQHVTDIEAQLCLNQLCYVFFAQGIADQQWESLKSFSLDDFLGLRKEGMFIVESHKKFVRETNPAEPFNGQIELVRSRSINKGYFAKLRFNLNESASFGELSLVLRT